MAVNFVYGIVGGISGPQSHRDILRYEDSDCETITATGTSQATTVRAPSPEGRSSSCPACTVNTDQDVFLAQGTNPTAVNGSGRMLLSGQMCDIYLAPGEKLAVILKS